MANVIETAKAATIAYNEKNWDKVKAVFVEKGVYDEKSTGRRIQGVNQIIEAWQGWGKAIPDSKATFVAEYASGDTAVLEVVWRGVHTGPLQMPTGTIQPSNKRIEIPACHVVKVEGGKVQSFTHYFDMLALLTQIGAFKGELSALLTPELEDLTQNYRRASRNSSAPGLRRLDEDAGAKCQRRSQSA